LKQLKGIYLFPDAFGQSYKKGFPVVKVKMGLIEMDALVYKPRISNEQCPLPLPAPLAKGGGEDFKNRQITIEAE
jgi:hypothetical protein